ncbi:PAS domain-containing protein [Ensifer sp. ZNC0028]|uniref:PAS domain-containing protein n=1 Tax=Ensifer sp. ZNC0028 TaxID=1339236 RepID=UPI0009DED4FC
MNEAMRSNTTTELFRYWNTIRGKRELPRRDELEPSDIRMLLPNLFILERDRNAGISFRLAGTQVCALFGQELRGRQFGMLWLGSQAAKTHRITGQVMTHRVPLVLSAKGRTADAREVDIETLLLPLASSEGESDRVLGALSPLSRPYWLHATAIECLDATGMKVLDPDRTAVFREEEAQQPSGTVAKSPATGAFSSEFRQFGHLRILEGGRRD